MDWEVGASNCGPIPLDFSTRTTPYTLNRAQKEEAGICAEEGSEITSSQRRLVLMRHQRRSARGQLRPAVFTQGDSVCVSGEEQP